MMRIAALPIVVWTLTVVVVSSLSAQQPDPHTGDAVLIANQQQILLTAVLGFMSTIVTIVVAMWKDSRNRRWEREEKERQRQWDIEDRERARKELHEKINENTEISRAAHVEANDVNHKILDLTRKFESVQLDMRSSRRERHDDMVAAQDTLDRVDETTQETLRTVKADDAAG